jgi:hypothetical protein
MQLAHLRSCTGRLPARRLPVALQSIPNWFPILGSRFHNNFFNLLFG